MSLMNCPECSHKVSDQASRCPQCAYPIAAAATAEDVQTIEKTSKSFKKQLAQSAVLFVIGVITTIAGAQGNMLLISSGLLMTIFAAAWYFRIKFMIWWHHE